jgi:hypothetical protein
MKTLLSANIHLFIGKNEFLNEKDVFFTTGMPQLKAVPFLKELQQFLMNYHYQ